MTFRIKTNSKRSHIRKWHKLMKTNVFGGYERVSDNEFDMHSKIGKS